MPRSRPNNKSRKSSSRSNSRALRNEEDEGSTRLQKVMAAAGIGSRRHCEEMILAGRVEVDGKAVRKLGTKVDPATQQVRVDGELIKTARTPVYYLVNKPEGVVCTNSDPSGRTRVVDLVPFPDGEHLYTVGRLDLSSEGLILVTNDGELANRLTHPRYGVEKTYLALVAGKIPPEAIDKLRNGVHLAEGMARCTAVYVKKMLPQSTLLEIVLSEGKNREIRRILAKVGHKVLTLKRIAVGDVKLRDLKPGEFRKPTRDELKSLQNAKPTRRKPAPRRRPEAASSAETSGDYEAPLIDTRDRSEDEEFVERAPPQPREVADGGERPKRKKPLKFRSDRDKKNRRQPPGHGTIIGGE
jgi:23S rRNA pseudouridine2605 synthase